MNIIWFSWKDRRHPDAGGAETVSGEIMDRLVRDGHTVRLITAQYKNSERYEVMNGIEIFRSGNRYTVYAHARHVYTNDMAGWADVVIDEMNTIPFGAGLYTKSSKKFLLAYQLAREVWFYQMKFPFSLIGFWMEPIVLRILSLIYPQTITESASSKSDLRKYGLKDVKLFRIGMSLPPLGVLSEKVISGVILSLGAVRPMKRTLHAVKAFESARDKNEQLTMVIAGDISTKYAKKVVAYIKKSRHSNAIDVKGRVSTEDKISLMRSADILLVTSVKEGWGLIVTEANSQGVPAIVYDADGLRDSVQNNKTGMLCPAGDYRAMGNEINKIFNDATKYRLLRHEAWEWSKQFTFENSYRDFIKILNIEDVASK